MKLLGATGSHVGNVREANQDRVFFRGMVAALADGMGGHQGGERAAELAIGEFENAANQLSEGDLIELVLSANREVHGHASDNGLPGMGTTLVALTLHYDNTITVANVGDSRAYWLRGDYMGQITEDHSFVEDLVRQGRLSPADAATHPQRNILTRAVGIGAEVEVDRFPIQEPAVGDRFLLCSDGLFNELTEEEIVEILVESSDVSSAAARLIEATLKTPCRDNVTVAVVDLVEDDDPRLPPDTATEPAAKVITAPVPVVSKSVLHEPRVKDGLGDGGASQGSSSTAGTLLLDEADDVNHVDPELFMETAELEVVEQVPMTVRPRSRLLMGAGALALAAIVAVGGFFFARSYARSGYFIAEDAASGELSIFQGRRGGFLGFDPLLVSMTGQTLPADDQTSQAMIAEEFSTLAAAEEVLERLSDRAEEAEATAAEATATDDLDAVQAPSESSDEDADASDSNANLGGAEGTSESSTSTTAG